MKTLSLHVNKKHFEAIASGELALETRSLTPQNADKYVVETETSIEAIPYDAIRFICGKGEEAKKMTVEVKHAEFIIFTDDEGNDLTFIENGVEYYVCCVEYTLGEIKNK